MSQARARRPGNRQSEDARGGQTRLVAPPVPGRPAVALLAGMFVAATAFTVLTAAPDRADAHRRHRDRALPARLRHPGPPGGGAEQPSTAPAPSSLTSCPASTAASPWPSSTRSRPSPACRSPRRSRWSATACVGADFPVGCPPPISPAPGRQLYRVSTTWVSANGGSRIPQPPSYVYVTPDRSTQHHTDATTETLPGGATVTTCPSPGPPANSPFGIALRPTTLCWSKANGTDRGPSARPGPAPAVRASVALDVPDADRGRRPGRRGQAGRAQPRADLGPVPGRNKLGPAEPRVRDRVSRCWPRPPAASTSTR